MTTQPPAREFHRQLRYVPLLAAGVLLFLGVVFLGDLTGLLWLIDLEVFGWWIKLSPSVLGPTTDWVVWGASFLAVISPGIVSLASRKTEIKPDAIVVLTSFVLPLLSLVTVSYSHFIGATLLVGSGFLAVYTLVSRSGRLLGMEIGSAARPVCAELFGFLTLVAAGGVVSLLLWPGGVFIGLISGYSTIPTDTWLGMLAIDLEVFYLARPLLFTLFMALAVVGVVALFREPFQSITPSISRRLMNEKHPAENHASPSAASQSGRKVTLRACFPYVILAASVALGIAITIYPYAVAKVRVVFGSDIWFYADRLFSMMMAANPFSMLEADRGFFVLILFAIMRFTQLDVRSVLILAPSLLSALLVMSAFALVKEGTGRPWLAGLAALLSVVSAQTNVGMDTGILANWFSLSLMSFMFALALRSIRLHSTLAAVGSLLLSLALLGSYTYMWLTAVAILAVALVATLLSFQSRTRDQWRHESRFLAALLAGTLALPVALGYVAVIPLLGYRPAWFDPGFWMNFAWNYFAGRTSPQVLALAPAAFEEAFAFLRIRMDLPFLTLLSVVGLADSAAWRGSFRRVVAAMVLVPLAVSLVSPDVYSTWRGLYMIPVYLTGALGVDTVIRRLNGKESSWNSRGRLALAGTFATYVFLSHLGYSLRALDLLIMVAS